MTCSVDRGGIVSRKTVATVLAALILVVLVKPAHVDGQQTPNDEILRRAKTKVQPAYPELAKRMRLVGTVKIEVVVATNGNVNEAKIVGGHPVLANAALEAAKKWHFEPGPTESSGVIEFRFDSQ
jgi:TonB family protein